MNRTRTHLLRTVAPVLLAAAGLPAQAPIGLGWASTSINAKIFRHDALASYGDLQFVAFYDGEGRIVLGRRQLGSPDWETRVTSHRGNVADAHNVVCILVDGDGYLHVAFDHRGHPLHYCRGRAPGSLELDDPEPMLGDHEKRVTYPEFYRLPDGDLLFLYRDGASGNGNLVANRYRTADRRWQRVHDNLLDGEGRRNAYWQCCVDDRGTIHLSWVWRETPDAATNHDLAYARSADGGVTWQRTDGSDYVLPITAASSEYALRIAEGRSLINTTAMAADAAGNPYIASWWSPEGTEVPQYHLVRHDGTRWHATQISDRRQPFRLGGPGTKRVPLSRPRLLVDDRGETTAAYVVLRDDERGGVISLASTRDVAGGEWHVEDLSPTPVGRWEPSLDSELWRSRRELHLFVQRVEQGDGERSIELAPQPVTVLEWRPQR